MCFIYFEIYRKKVLKLYIIATIVSKKCDNYMKQMFKICIILYLKFVSSSDERNKRHSEKMLNKNNKCSFSYLYTLTKSFRLFYYRNQASSN